MSGVVGNVYFIREQGGAVKIGWTTKTVARRLHNLQIGNPRPLSLLAVIEGVGQEIEAQWHDEFHYCRCRGEWFHPLPDLLMKIRNLAPPVVVPTPAGAVSVQPREGSMQSLSDWLQAKNIRQGSFAQHLEITDSTMSQIMTGRRKIGRGMATRIELATGGSVRAAVLLGLEAA